MRIEDIINNIRQHMDKKNLSIAAMARDAGLRRSTLDNMFSTEWNPTVKTLKALQKAIRKGKAS